ncbi:MAG: hypothetical protein U1E56_13115 [Bauldia sp.]
MGWRAPLLAGAAYGAAAFAAGFVLGTARVLVVAPLVGELTATAIEVPLMLIFGWVLCRRIVTAFSVPSRFPDRLLMSAVAFGVLMAAEAALATLAFGRSVGDYLAALGTAAGAIGLAGQVAFSVLPIVRVGSPGIGSSRLLDR